MFQQLGQAGARILAVAGQADARQHHLTITGIGQMPQLLQNALLTAAAHRPPGPGNHTVGTAAVAAVLHLDKGPGVFGKAFDGQFLKPLALLVGANVHNALLLAVQHLADQLGQDPAGTGPCHHVGLGDFSGLLGKGLGVAAGEHRHGAGIFPFGAAQPFAALLIAEIGHGTAVDDVDIGFLTGGDHSVAVCLKQLCHGTGFILIHFASQGIKTDAHARVHPLLSRYCTYYIGTGPKAQAGQGAIFGRPRA